MSHSRNSTRSPVLVEEFSFPSYLRILSEWRVALCIEHGSCYTRHSLPQHLLRKHRIKRPQRQNIEQNPQYQSIANTLDEVIQPSDGVAEIDNLPTSLGFLCHIEHCHYRSRSTGRMRQHYNQEHGWKKSQGPMPWHHAHLQTLFQEKEQIRYFAVIPAHSTIRPSASPHPHPLYIYPHANAPEYRVASSSAATNHPPSLEVLLDEYHTIQSQNVIPRTIPDSQHVSEITPWFRTTGIHTHLAGLDLDLIGDLYRLPEPEETLLSLVCSSIDRLWRQTEQLLHPGHTPRLSRRNARLLNTFSRGEISQDPIQSLQNGQSRTRYIQTWQKLICYWSRVMDNQALPAPLFQPTEGQTTTWDDVLSAAQDLDDYHQSTPDDTEVVHYERRLGERILCFCLEIIQQPLPSQAFDSILVSFAALLFWSPTQKQWMMVGNYTSYLSQLIYSCQIWILALSILEHQHHPELDLSNIIIGHRDRWLLNDTTGPVAELLENRLYGFRIGMTEVPPAQVRWDRDGQTITFQDVSLSLSELSRFIQEGISRARTIFEQELCLSGPSRPGEEIPQFHLDDLVDNWDATHAGASFLTDARNHAYIQPHQEWLFRRVSQDPVLFPLFWTLGADQTWRISLEMVEQYEATILRFLRTLVGPFFIGSGQQARRIEFLEIRWRNTLLHTRDLFLHDGQMLFILDYHKTRHRSNASRWPARFLLPEVAQLVTQYLVLIMPFRQWLHHKAHQDHSAAPTPLCDFLWASYTTSWSEDYLTKAVIQAGQQILGKRIHVRAWRQITVGIAIKKFGALASLFIEGSTDEDDHATEEHDGSMAAVFHYQAAHTPHTGNQVYGGTVNFRAGLTDAGLQEFRQASEAWHQLIRQPSSYSTSSPLKRRWPGPSLTPSSQEPGPSTEWEWDESPTKRARSQVAESTLVQRFRRCREPQPARGRWTMEQAQSILERMYGPEAQYRSPNQRQALEYILRGASEVIAVLQTNEGKSLLYLLPCQLPGARTTVVVLPLVVLKQDMLRRCQDAGIAATIWDQTHESTHLGSSSLILVSVEQAVHVNFRTFLLRLQLAQQLDRVVFDECHLILTAQAYRKRIALVPTLREIHYPMVFLTGTLPPSMEEEFHHTMFLSHPRLVRSLTTRRDLSYEVVSSPYPQNFLSGFAIPRIQQEQIHLSPADRAIVYCRTKAVTEKVAGILQCPFYHAESGTQDEKAAVLQAWHHGTPNWIIATSAFGMGIDHPRVRLVIHLDAPSSLIDFAQEAGRLGRDQQGGHSVILLPASWKAQPPSRPGQAMSQEVQAMHAVLSQPQCRVAAMSSFLDGTARACAAPDPLCDQCRHGSMDPLSSSPSSTATGPSESTDDPDLDLTIGSTQRMQQVQRDSQQLQDYEDYLQALYDTCLICQILPRTSPDPRPHPFIQCWNPQRQVFLQAKRQAQKEGAQHGGWIQRFAGCFYCYNPQTVCSQRGQGACQYPDLVMQACWAIYQRKTWREEFLSKLGGEHVQSDEALYMLWLGQKRVIFGIEGSNAVWVAYHVFQSLLEE